MARFKRPLFAPSTSNVWKLVRCRKCKAKKNKRCVRIGSTAFYLTAPHVERRNDGRRRYFELALRAETRAAQQAVH